MRQVITFFAFVFLFAACNSHSDYTTRETDSTSINSTATTPDTLSNASGTGATGTTGTGTVSDSGNASHPGSDTTYHQPGKDSSGKK